MAPKWFFQLMPRTYQFLEDDILSPLVNFPLYLILNKFQTFLSAFMVLVLFLHVVFSAGYVLFVEINPQLIKTTSSLMLLCSYAGVSYITGFILRPNLIESFRKGVGTFTPLGTASGRLFKNMENEGKIAIILMYFTIIIAFISSTLFMPFDDAIDLLMSSLFVKKYFSQFSTVFAYVTYMFIYHSGEVMICYGWMVMYLCLHAKYQFYLLNEKFGSIFEGNQDRRSMDSEEYQEFIRSSLKKIIKNHQNIRRFTSDVNEYLYFPLMAYSMSGLFVLIGTVVLLLANMNLITNLRMAFTIFLTVFIVTLFATCGQTVVDQSDNFYNMLTTCSCYVLNKHNQKLLRILIINSMEPLRFSSSSIVVLDHTLLIKLYKGFYSMVTFLQSQSYI